MAALKEWATVVKALEDGNQTILLRKGGIMETASGFRVESKKFFLFPTYEHQEARHLKPQFQKYLEDIKKNPPEDGFNKITSVAEVLDEIDVSSEEKIKKLSSFHVLSESYIQERMNWMPEKPMKVIFLKVLKIPEKNILLKSEFQGCKSWIDINEEVQSEKAVLSDTELESKLVKFKEILN